ncbi:MFS transporter [Streptomyces sp. NBC_01142]|uniref:MFS transporter n=1 Tax=Streptomyces sp. NBC_01142 TaxID=2975865 RepID=UPI00224D9D6E|nr:MFS transporter [Streptomyces sp. NBC_01142]MCX4821821.1 MFS transporter [Streptomyces sp. NBC_01142]
MKKRYALRRYVSGAAAARTGDEMSGPALLLAGLAVTGSASSASSLLAGLTISAAVGGPVFGVLLDRSARPGRLLTGALAVYASALVVILLSLGRLPVALTVLIAVFAGLLGPALSGGWTSQLPRVVSPGELPRANALDAMTFNFASLVGPALAGVVAGVSGASAGVIVSVVLICLALPAARALPAVRPAPTPAPTPVQGPAQGPAPVPTSVPGAVPAPPSVVADLAAGFRAIVRARPLARATAASVIACVAEGMLIACSPLLGERVLGGAGRGAILLSGIAVAALAANAVLSRHPALMRPDTVVWCSTLVLAAALLLAATARPALLVAAVVLAGIGEGPRLTALFAVRHREAPERLRSQIFTTGASLKLTGFAVGAGIAGPLAARSLPAALVAAAGFALLAALSYAPMRHWR